MAEDDHLNVDFEEGLSWIPANVLEDCDDDPLEEKSENLRHKNRHRNELKSPAAELAIPLSKSISKPPPNQRLRHSTNWGGGAGGPGMQAIFLDSGQKSCGTGVFLPRRAGSTDFQLTNKPVCSPVLLPARVVQALKLNVHELGLQIKPPEFSNNAKGIKNKTVGNSNNKKGSEVTSKTCVISQNHHRSSSPDIFLPKEWTY